MVDTVINCRAQAATNNAQASKEPLDSRRAIFAASAAAWNVRADTLERIAQMALARGAVQVAA